MAGCPPLLTGINLGNCVKLCIIRALIHIQGGLPASFLHIARRITGQCDIQSLQALVLEMTRFNMPGDEQFAVTFGRWLKPDAGAGCYAITCFKISALYNPIYRLIHCPSSI